MNRRMCVGCMKWLGKGNEKLLIFNVSPKFKQSFYIKARLKLSIRKGEEVGKTDNKITLIHDAI